MSIAPLAPPAIAAPARPRGRLGVAFGRRFLLLWLAGLAWCIPAVWNKSFLYVGLLWDGILFIAWIADLLHLPKPNEIVIERCWDHPLSIGSPGMALLRLRNQAASGIEGVVVDEVPAGIRPAPPEIPVGVPARSEAVVSYEVAPATRGDLDVGRAYLRYGSAMQMAERWAVAEIGQTIRVYPDIEQARKQTIYLTRSRQIGREQRLLRLRGQGREFESLRDYREGDEFRDICWTATARRGKLVTKLHQVERSQPVWIVLDCGRLMRARTAGLTKLDHAVNAALCLTQLALFSGDRVGILAYGSRINRRIAPARGAAHMRVVLEQLAQIQDELPEADHMRAASSLLSIQKRRSLIVWVTDLAETYMTPEVVEAAGHMLSRHLVLFILMGQPDLSAAAAQRPERPDEMYRSVAAQEMVYRRELLLGRLRERGALTLEVEPGKLSATLLNQYLFVKERMLL